MTFVLILSVTTIFSSAFMIAFDGLLREVFLGSTLIVGVVSMFMLSLIQGQGDPESALSGTVPPSEHIIGDSYGMVYFECVECEETYQNVDSGKGVCHECGEANFETCVTNIATSNTR